ncbi:unnamed protein product [Auanema sp. JU1783]|nr:unnamed protein product [Auanema sp. JU1783]
MQPREKDNHEKLSIVDVGMEEAKLINALGMYSADDLYSFVNKLRSAVAIVNAEEQLELHRAKVLNIFDV